MTNKSGLDPQRFEAVVDGKPTHLYILRNAAGAEMTVCNYGGVVVSLMMPDNKDHWANVVLGMEDIDGLVNAPEPTLGAAIGRYGNRIAFGRFMLDGKAYQIGLSQAPHSLHGGFKGFNRVVWDAEQQDEQTLVLRYLSADGEEGFPGNMEVIMTYRLTDENEFRIDYSAICDQNTLCNLTNHSYFNLDGIEDGKAASFVGDHLLTICAEQMIAVDEKCIPLGHRQDVAGTPFDFRQPHTIGERIDDKEDQQIRNGAGYDHCFCIDRQAPAYKGKNPVAGLRLAAVAESPATGRIMTTYTTEPGVQLYTGNWLSGFAAYHGATFPARSGFCLEAQHHPDSINQPAFEQPILLAGQVYNQTTIYAFGVRE